MKVSESLRTMIFGWMVPAVTSIAASSDTVPCRTYSNSRRSGRPGRIGRLGCLRDLACIEVFSSPLSKIVFSGGLR